MTAAIVAIAAGVTLYAVVDTFRRAHRSQRDAYTHYISAIRTAHADEVAKLTDRLNTVQDTAFWEGFAAGEQMARLEERDPSAN